MENKLKNTLKERYQAMTTDGDLPQASLQTELKTEGTPVPHMAINIQSARDRIVELQNFIKYMMVPNIDYGFVKGCPKPMLLKSGAEKLCDIYGFSKQIEITQRINDWDKGIFYFEIKAILINKKTGIIESEGVGCCTNKEKKFAGQDAFSVINSVLKMAKKRAIVDATLAATRSSGIFGQDLEGRTA